MILGTFKKQPIERIDYDISFKDYLDSDTILASPAPVVTISPSGELTNDVTTIMTGSQKLKVWLSAGNSGTTYKVTVTVETAAGRVKQIEFKVKVRDD